MNHDTRDVGSSDCGGLCPVWRASITWICVLKGLICALLQGKDCRKDDPCKNALLGQVISDVGAPKLKRKNHPLA